MLIHHTQCPRANRPGRCPLQSRSRGQAIVEFALSSIILFMLIAAVVDLGLIFLSYQTMISAVKEGLAYGTYRPVIPNPNNPNSPLANDTNIRYRLRHSNIDPSTGAPSISFINLLDLNRNGQADEEEAGVLDQYIVISAYQDGNENVACTNRARNCWLRIAMRLDYHFFFPLAPAFDDTLEIRVVRDQQIVRSSQ